MTKSTKTQTRTLLVTTVCTALLSACSVSPEAFTDRDHSARASELLQRVTRNQEPVSGPIGMYEAMARAIKYNLDYRVQIKEQALRARALDVANLENLPKLVASIDYAGRNNESGGVSRSLITGLDSLEPSTSIERNNLNADLTLSWDILDFGLSYYRAKQAADEVLIAEERKRQVLGRIIEDVRTAWWRAVSAQRLLERMAILEGQTHDAMKAARSQAGNGKTAPLAALTYQRELLKIRRELQSLGREMRVAKQQLAALMNMAPGESYTLKMPAGNKQTPKLTLSDEEMLNRAIANRPELREIAYKLRMGTNESKAVNLRMLPNLKAFVGINWSSNDYLYNQSWLGWGAQTSWNVLNLLNAPAEHAKADAQMDLLDDRMLALTMAVATQVHVARARYELRLRELDTATEYFGVQRDILEQTNASYKAGSTSDQTRIREEMNSVLAAVRYDLAMADLQNAYANVHASIGADPITVSVSSKDPIADIARALKQTWMARGDTIASE